MRVVGVEEGSCAERRARARPPFSCSTENKTPRRLPSRAKSGSCPTLTPSSLPPTPPQFTKALTAYEAALKTADAPSAVAALRSARAGAFLLTGRHREASNECDAALDAVPNHAVALFRRARAKEGLGQLKAAAADAARAARADPSSAELAEAERRLKDMVGRRPGAGGAGNGAVAAPAAAQAQQQAQQPRAVATTVALPDGSCLEPLALHPGATYAELLAAVKARAPAAWPFQAGGGGRGAGVAW